MSLIGLKQELFNKICDELQTSDLRSLRLSCKNICTKLHVREASRKESVLILSATLVNFGTDNVDIDYSARLVEQLANQKDDKFKTVKLNYPCSSIRVLDALLPYLFSKYSIRHVLFTFFQPGTPKHILFPPNWLPGRGPIATNPYLELLYRVAREEQLFELPLRHALFPTTLSYTYHFHELDLSAVGLTRNLNMKLTMGGRTFILRELGPKEFFYPLFPIQNRCAYMEVSVYIRVDETFIPMLCILIRDLMFSSNDNLHTENLILHNENPEVIREMRYQLWRIGSVWENPKDKGEKSFGQFQNKNRSVRWQTSEDHTSLSIMIQKKYDQGRAPVKKAKVCKSTQTQGRPK